MRIPQVGAPVCGTSAFRSLPKSAGNSALQAAVALEKFLLQGRANVVLSGAGISVDSDIPDYRGMKVVAAILLNCYQALLGRIL
jgi:hypothetical protein